MVIQEDYIRSPLVVSVLTGETGPMAGVRKPIDGSSRNSSSMFPAFCVIEAPAGTATWDDVHCNREAAVACPNRSKGGASIRDGQQSE
jgi:hypothetical protein